MGFHLQIKGGQFNEMAPLGASIHALQQINTCFEHSFGIVRHKEPILTTQFGKPHLLVTQTHIGSLSLSAITSFVGGIAPMLPELAHFGYQSFDVISKSWKAIETINKLFKVNKQLPPVKIIESPGTTLAIGDNNTISITNDIRAMSKLINPMFQKLAELIERKEAESINLSSDDEHEYSTLEFNKSNRKFFGIPEQTISITEKINLECQLYRINKKTKRGRLDIMKDDFVLQKQIPFTILQGDVNKYIDSLKEPSCVVTAVADYKIDAFNGKEISKLFLYDIQLDKKTKKLQ